MNICASGLPRAREKNMHEIWKMTAFIGVQYILGKRGSYPYGLMVGFGLYKITLLVIVSDIMQTLLLLNFFDYFSRKIAWLKKKKEGCETRKKEGVRKKLWKTLKQWGAPGIMVVAALPYGGGALTGSILAMSVRMEKKKAFYFIVSGCIIGAILFYLGFTGIKAALD